MEGIQVFNQRSCLAIRMEISGEVVHFEVLQSSSRSWRLIIKGTVLFSRLFLHQQVSNSCFIAAKLNYKESHPRAVDANLKVLMRISILNTSMLNSPTSTSSEGLPVKIDMILKLDESPLHDCLYGLKIDGFLICRVNTATQTEIRAIESAQTSTNIIMHVGEQRISCLYYITNCSLIRLFVSLRLENIAVVLNRAETTQIDQPTTSVALNYHPIFIFLYEPPLIHEQERENAGDEEN